ncbi:type IX secretion system PorP/SprF family membrane protein [Kordia periserrulae]|uniref:Type IX secretion system PorP/SprF family membrane protein n=1 Tax=Kordia periserrulae TaxID=701523 RepID=A0A2T6C674_9FLAO|nr:type IX secretion system membrane protein PorP/SprF [Kordia periserrulae]PTX63818.1 type IX secretion system PorP/SprF family membrane protein [Kordia periserrulae]
MKFKKYLAIVAIAFGVQCSFSQDGLPVYVDYLSDNLYLIHPSMAGASNASKIRLTARQQWFDVDNAPSLQTLSFNTRVGDKVGVGAIVYNDENGNFSQQGVYLTFAYHLLLSRNRVDLNQLSFGISTGFTQGTLDETGFDIINNPDPIISGGRLNTTYFNVDFGASYYFLDFFAHLTIKNALPTQRDLFSQEFESKNQRRYLASAGYTFGAYDSDWTYEPSIMFQYTEETQESSIDANIKVYRSMEFGSVWGGLSYRRSLDGAEFVNGTQVDNQKLQYITPFVGVNYNRFMFAYTYSYQANSLVLSNGGYHQITLGYDFGDRRDPYDCNCPAIN